MSTFPTTNISLSNILTATAADTIAPFSASNMYSITNTSSLPIKGQPISWGFFRGLTLVSSAVAAPTTGIVLEILYGSPTLPTADSTTSKALTTSPTPPTMVSTVRGFVPFFQGSQYQTVTSLNLSQSYTKSAYVFITQTQSGNGNIVSSANTSNTVHYMWFHNGTNLGAGHHLQFQGPSPIPVSDPVATPLNTWVHYVVTYDNATTRMVLYKNGIQVSAKTEPGLAWSGGGTSGVQIGSYTNGNSLNGGYIDNVRVYSSALSAADVTQLYNADILSSITFTNNGGTLNNWVVNVSLPYKTGYLSSFQDIRFYSGSTLLNHWIESVVAGVSASVWLLIPALSNGTVITVTSGNTASTGNAKGVFPVYDNFSGTTIDSSLWATAGTGTGTITVNNALSINSNTISYILSQGTHGTIATSTAAGGTTYLGLDVIVEAQVTSTNSGSIPEMCIRANTSTNSGIKSRMDCRGGSGDLNSAQGLGSLLNNPFSTWAHIHNGTTVGMTTNVAHVHKFEAVGGAFKSYLDGVQAGITYTNAATVYNSDGKFGLMNHNGFVTWNWVRAYRATTQTIGYTL
jgi:hypothetical protein